MFKIIALLIIVLIAALLLYAASKPDAFRIERSVKINAAPATVFALINDLHDFNRWNPFAKGDPTLQLVYSGAGSGPGAAYSWTGNSKSGAGRMQITEASPPSRLVMALEFSKPLAAQNTVQFTLQPQGDATQVTWTMTGRSAYVHKLMSTVFNMDKMVGGEFEKGLASLKELSERSGRP